MLSMHAPFEGDLSQHGGEIDVMLMSLMPCYITLF